MTTQFPPQNFLDAKKLLGDSKFFSQILANLKVVPMPEHTLATDGVHLFIGPLAHTMPIAEMKAGIVHELLHITNRHHIRMLAFSDEHFEEFNQGADMAINPILMNYQYAVGDDWIMPTDDSMYDKPAEEITAMLIAKKKKNEEQRKKEKEQEQDNDNNPDQGQKQDANKNPDETSKNQAETKPSPRNILFPFPGRSNDESDTLPSQPMATPHISSAEIHEEEERLGRLIKTAQKIAQMAGETASWQTEEFEITPANQVPKWINDFGLILEGSVYGNLTWETLNRRRLSTGQIAPGFEMVGLGTPILAIDASASVTIEQISRQTASACDLFARYNVEQIRLIVCDEEITRDDIIPLHELSSALRISGQRGTRFAPVFQRVMETADQDTLLLYATDLLVFPSEWNSIESWPEHTIWLTDSNKKAPFGTTIQV